MVDVFDVAAYILRQKGSMSAMKLQKLVYYAQAWSLVWDEEPMFPERIEAWANGPVVPDLYDWHRGQFKISPEDIKDRGQPDRLTDEHSATLDLVLGYYGDHDPQWLSDLTHSEDPWTQAREGVPDGARSDQKIHLDGMLEYYSSLRE